MRFTMLAGKIHRATITDANLEYEGSVTVDPDLLEAAGIPVYAQVQIYNITNGERFETYTMLGKRGSREVIINGAAAHKASKGDKVIIACYVRVREKDVGNHQPYLVYVDENNSILGNLKDLNRMGG
jgi:aspartate 1-decarboxylase